MFSTLNELLFAQAAVTAIILLIFGLMLARRNLFRWTTAGFWAWAAFALYFLINPLASIRWNIEHYYLRLLLSGGLTRGEWIMLVSAVGMVAFFVTYLGTSCRPVTWKLPVRTLQYTPLMVLVVAGFVGLAGLSLLTYRAGIVTSSREISIESGRFTGATTGYEYVAHTFLFVPVVLPLLSQSRAQRLLGWLLGVGYVLLSMPDPWARFSMVSMLLAMMLADTVRRERGRPRFIFIVAIVLIGAVLQLRGHASLRSGQEFGDFAARIPGEAGAILSSGDTAMLATWYVESYVKDSITGYDYGIPLINYVLFGIIPNRLFPQKYFLVDWLRAQQTPLLDPTLLTLQYGAKPSLLGSFYANGGLLAVVLQMGLMGFLCRRMDGMLSLESPLLVKATAIGWLSMLWIIWGSHDSWGLIRVGSILIPTILLWFLAPKAVRTYTPASTGTSNVVLPYRRGPVVSRHE